MRILCHFIAITVFLAVTHASAQSKSKLDAKVVDQVDALINLMATGQPATLENLDPLYRAAILQDGNVQPLLSWLKDQRDNASGSDAEKLAEIEVHVAARRGDLQRASDVLNELLEKEEVAKTRIDLRLWQARLFDALGEVDDAKQTYQSLIELDLSEAQQQMVRLRLALMGLLGTADANSKSDEKELIELAKTSQDNAFRNRAANVLAVQNQHAEAVKLFTVEGEGTLRFRSASRVTEWAIRANDRDQAIESAWDAVRSSELKRDRRYALALLVESYRMQPKATPPATPPKAEPDAAAANKTAAPAKTTTAATGAAVKMQADRIPGELPASTSDKAASKKAGLEALIEAFAKENEGEQPLTDEMRAVWVELLRELGRHDDAIALFKSSADPDSGFSVEMRRELLEMEGSVGNNDRLIASYRDLIKQQPDELTWRSGLTRVLLEQGQDESATQLWNDYIDQLQKGSRLLMAAQALGDVGLDDLTKKAVERMVTLKADDGQALLFWADLQQRRGRVDRAEATLNRLHGMTDVDDAVRSELASEFERVGRQDKAIEVTEAIRANRKIVAEDVEMRLAWLYSEVGDEEKALQQWLTLWRKITSIPRRRYVEDRLMTVASRLGTLADIAIELEEKLADGNADDREAGLLVRIYSRVNDSVAASEILEEYMTQTGRNEIDRLQEKGRIYQICNDYWNYEKVIERLVEVDPAGKTEYLRQLALSMLERGKAQEARAVLLTLRDADDGKDSIGGEFEAGVLSLVGMKREAADAYRRGIATYPDRIESYLLLANLLKDMGQTDRAIGMFQYLAENADRDDLFTIAIDGLLNMEAKGKVMQWARRITLERLAGRDDKNYLYQLLADLSAEVNDKSGQIRAMENSLAVSGTRRLSVLRECMDLSSKIRGGAFYSSSSRGPTNAGNQPFFAFGRRLIGLGELMPPQVFLDLGQAFLADGDVVSAERTFALARNLADQRAYEQQVASIFEKSGKRSEALERYDRLLRTSPSDVALMARVAKLNEQEGHDDVAFRFYERGFNLLLAQTPLTTQEDKSKNTARYSWGGNRDAYQMYAERLLSGLLVTVPDDTVDTLLKRQYDLLDNSLQQLAKRVDEGQNVSLLAESPQLEKHSAALRRIYMAFDRINDLESLDLTLLRRFSDDKNLMSKFATERIAHGRYDSVRRLLKDAEPSDEQRKQLTTLLGDTSSEELGSRLLAPKDMWQRFLPAWMNNDRERARAILRRVDQTKGTSQSNRVTYVIINGMAVPQQLGGGTKVSTWMRMALELGDEGLALQFARSRLQEKNRYGYSGVKQLFDGYRNILPPESFQSLARYAANLYKDDKDRTIEYLWVISQLRDQLDADDLPADDELLEMVEDTDLSISYSFPFSLAMECFPASIRSEAIAHVIDGIDKKSRPRELIRIPFQYQAPIDEATTQVILDAIKSGIQPALQDSYLKYAIYYMPRQGTALRCADNAELALGALDLLTTDAIRKREDQVCAVAENVKAVILHQMGRTNEALEIIVPKYDPEKKIVDYYQRYSWTWVTGELLPAAPDRFLAVLDSKVEDGKRTVAQTDQRFAIIQRIGDDKLLNDAYQQAMADHPSEEKYIQKYEKWEQSAGRIANAIAISQSQLTELPDDDAGRAKAKTIKKRLGDLWFSVNHRVNGLPLWSITDDEDIKNFDAEVQARKKAAAASADANKKDPPKPAATKPDKKKDEKKTYPQTIAGVKSAIADKNADAAQNSLRALWRGFPPVVDGPYSYRSRQKRINGLAWPEDPPKKEATPEPTDEQRKQAAGELRQKQRGGLATLTPPERKPPKEKPQSAWKVLAAEPFAVTEMHRILRSRTAAQISSISDVVVGLLQADRLQHGDEAVFQSLVEKIENGQVGTVELSQFFHLLDEDPGRISEQNQSVIDVLLRQLDLTQVNMARQLAKVCGTIGQHDRAAALYTHCALLAPAAGVTFTSLIEQASDSFEGEELVALAERMFALTNHDESTVNRMLDLRLELLDPPAAAKRSEVLFQKLDTDESAYKISQAIRGAELFAKAGDYDRATKCLVCAVMQHGQPLQMNSSYYYYGSSTRTTSVSRADLIRVFPADAEQFKDYLAWLKLAAQKNAELIKDGLLKPEIAVELQSIIAVRLCQREDLAKARTAMACISDDMIDEAKKHRLLAIDVFRMSNLPDRALPLESTLHQRNELSHLRLGDLLRDTLAVEGEAAARQLAEKLLQESQDKDLVAAAQELTPSDQPYADRLAMLVQQRDAAEQEYESRSQAARERRKTRDEWKAKTREKK